MNARASAQQYRQTAVQSAVLEASPHRLVALLLAGLRERLQLALACLEKGDLARKGQAIGEACRIIAELDGSLDHAAGGEVAAGLAALYDYAQRRLLDANLHNDPTPLQEVDGLIAEIESAWRAIEPAAA
ncbi:flagellar export chaperone FliS [Thermomonas alba]|uniref:flagellar export chaperone FliS n=1 Tax=Thermomonas alba TaxID=2888525 RepID=UPI001F040708|nr:flagellar export chaperone FliS [Thermomonas alba]